MDELSKQKIPLASLWRISHASFLSGIVETTILNQVFHTFQIGSPYERKRKTVVHRIIVPYTCTMYERDNHTFFFWGT